MLWEALWKNIQSRILVGITMILELFVVLEYDVDVPPYTNLTWKRTAEAERVGRQGMYLPASILPCV